MSQAASILILAAFLCFAGFSLASFLFRFCGQGGKYNPFAFVACIGLAGGLFSLFLEIAMTLTPGRSDGYYLFGMLLPCTRKDFNNSATAVSSVKIAPPSP